MMYYIAYGSNMNVGQMAHRCPDAEVVCKSVIKDWKLVFRYHATIEPAEGHEVPVVIWKISDADEKKLDRYEGYPIYYIKKHFCMELNGQTVHAMAYIMTEGRGLELPTKTYLNTIAEGYETFEIDTEFLMCALLDAS